MNPPNDFSVIIPAYNAQETISQSLKSVLNQTHPAKEIIVIDDGSTDDTAGIIKEIKKHNPRVQYHFQENRGVSSARNYGISLAKHENILFLDSDDVWLQDKILAHLQHLQIHSNCIASFSNYFSFNELKGNITEVNNYKNVGLITGHKLALNLCRINGSSSSFMGKRKVLMDLKGFNPRLEFGEDLDMWVRYSSYGNICDLKKVLVGIRNNPDKFKSYQMGSRWSLSELYFRIWSENKIDMNIQGSRRAARKILRVDLRRNLMHPIKTLREYPKYFKKKFKGLFKDVYFSVYGFYLYLVADLWMEFDLFTNNKRRQC